MCKLHKTIYGLKQTPRVWFEKLKETMISLGYHSTKSDSSLFTKFSKDMTMYVLIYVNGFIITCNNGQKINNLIKHLNQEFKIKDLGNLIYLLGIEVKRITNARIQLSQRKYIPEILHKAKIHEANSISTSMVSNLHLSKYKGEAIFNDRQYRNIVVAFQYATIIRSDIT